MIFGSRNIVSPIGIDLGAKSIKAVQLKCRRGAFELLAATTVQRESTQELAASDLSRLASMLRRSGFRGNRVFVACTPGDMHSAILELPPISSAAPLAKIAEAEMRRAANLSDQQFEMDFWDLPAPSRAASSSSVMAVAALCEKTSSLAELFEKSGLDVVAVDAMPAALARSCASLVPSGLAMVADLGVDSSTFVLFSQGRVVYHRTIQELGIGMLCRTIADEMQLDYEEIEFLLQDCGVIKPNADRPSEFTPRRTRLRGLIARHVDAISEEIESSLTYARHKYTHLPLTDLFLSGDGCVIGGMEPQLTARLGVGVSVASPARVVTVSDQFREVGASPRHLIACGLAMNSANK